MSTELIFLGTNRPELALDGAVIADEESARAVLAVLTADPVRARGRNKLDKILERPGPRLGIGLIGSSILFAASDLPALSLNWDALRSQHPDLTEWFVIGDYPTSSGVELIWKSSGDTVRHLSITDEAVDTDTGPPLPFEVNAQLLTKAELEAMYAQATPDHRRVTDNGEHFLLDVDGTLTDRADDFETDDDDRDWIPVTSYNDPDPDDTNIDSELLAELAAQAWFGFGLLDAPQTIRLHTYEPR